MTDRRLVPKVRFSVVPFLEPFWNTSPIKSNEIGIENGNARQSIWEKVGFGITVFLMPAFSTQTNWFDISESYNFVRIGKKRNEVAFSLSRSLFRSHFQAISGQWAGERREKSISNVSLADWLVNTPRKESKYSNIIYRATKENEYQKPANIGLLWPTQSSFYDSSHRHSIWNDEATWQRYCPYEF